jgi:membrane-bound inhibitor of C-type lysozyme
MKALLIIALTVLGLSACNEPTINTRYLCNQKEATLSVINEQTAALTLNNNTYQLSREKSASGNKYINKNVLFWSKDNEAMLIIEGTKYHCLQQ